MSIQLDKKKKTYTVRWYEKNQITGELVRRARRGFQTKKEARSFEDEVMSIHEYASFSQVKDLYLDSLAGYANNDTIKRRKRILDNYAAELFPLNVRWIKKEEIIRWRNKIASLNRAVETKNRVMEIVKAVSRFGNEVFDYPDFAKSLKAFPKKSTDIRDIKVLSQDDFALVMENCDNEVYKRFYTFLYYTGCRRGEALALSASDIHGKTANLNKSIRNYKNGYTPLKTRYSKRTIILTDKAYETIEPLLSLEGDFIFGGLEPIPVTNITRNFDKALAAAQLPHYRIHDLRHSFISNAILNGIDIVSISRYVGHADIEMTLNRYSHLLKDSEQRMVDRLNELNKAPDK